ncbi:hypothetical protein ULMA_26070 [Patiriisocius marinus]|uniref:STAS/SEC14 domain-containing protein n=1 Tax=Patiriisocius marinus TaxID=1397112 RepID=A0A5J4IRJ2_9FLAO|nr:hypothetical protein ULMA_26070 [Patiriisocius marinus]
MRSPLLETINLDFVKLEIYDEYIVTTVHEGVLFDHKKLDEVHKVFDKYFKHKPFGYISNRVFDYTVNPTSFIYSLQYENLVGTAIVCYNDKSYRNAQFESTLHNCLIEIFHIESKALEWISTQLESFKKKQAYKPGSVQSKLS